MRTKNPGQLENAFVKQIFDKETGKSMKCRLLEAESDEPRQMFSVGWWDHDMISYEKVMKQVTDALRLEQRQALCARGQLDSWEAAREKEKQMNHLSEEAREVFAAMTEIETPELQFYQQMEQGEITEEEYQKQRTAIMDRLGEKEKDFSAVVGRMDAINKAFSVKNPWIKMYAELEVPDILTKAQVRKWVGRVIVENLEKVEIVLPDAFLSWKEQLPAQLMEPGENPEQA